MVFHIHYSENGVGDGDILLLLVSLNAKL